MQIQLGAVSMFCWFQLIFVSPLALICLMNLYADVPSVLGNVNIDFFHEIIEKFIIISNAIPIASSITTIVASTTFVAFSDESNG